MTRSLQHKENRLLSKLLLAALSICCTCLTIEIVLRFTGYEGDYERNIFRFAAPFDVVRKDSWVLRPAAACFKEPVDESQADRDRHICVNDRPIPVISRKEPRRILFLGDSGTLGWGVSAEASFPALLNVPTDSRGFTSLEAINAGVYGFHNFDALKLYRERLVQLKPDVVVLGLFMANDLNYNLLAGDRMARLPAMLESTRDHLMDHSAFFHYTYLQLLRINHRYRLFSSQSVPGAKYSRLSLIDDIGLHMLHYRQGEIAGYRPDGDSVLMNYAYELLRRVLIEFRSTAEEHGAQFAVILLPAPPRIAGQYVSPVEPRIFQNMRQMGIELHPGKLEIDRPTRRVLSICRELEISCLDPAPALRAAGLQNVLLPGDDHYSAAGHRVIATEAARWFRDTNTFRGLHRAGLK